jgi:hypothetical protein
VCCWWQHVEYEDDASGFHGHLATASSYKRCLQLQDIAGRSPDLSHFFVTQPLLDDAQARHNKALMGMQATMEWPVTSIYFFSRKSKENHNE